MSFPCTNDLTQLGCLDLGKFGVQAKILGHIKISVDYPLAEQCKDSLDYLLWHHGIHGRVGR